MSVPVNGAVLLAILSFGDFGNERKQLCVARPPCPCDSVMHITQPEESEESEPEDDFQETLCLGGDGPEVEAADAEADKSDEN
jgi:hypothetical protein